jgi:hypothetical protein
MENLQDLGMHAGYTIFMWFWISALIAAVLWWILAALIDDEEGGMFVVGIGAFSFLVGVICMVIFIIMHIPFGHPEYRHLYSLEGEVTKVSNVLGDDGSSLDGKRVVTVDGFKSDVVMSDPRAANLEGKDVKLTCSVGWHYKAADTYSCSIAKIKN